MSQLRKAGQHGESVFGDELNTFLDGFEEQLEWHLTHICPECRPILTMCRNLSHVRKGLESMKTLKTDAAVTDEQVHEALRVVGQLLVFFGRLPHDFKLFSNPSLKD